MFHRTHLIFISILLFSLGVVFQLNGDDPLLQQCAIVVTWMPVALLAVFRYQLLQQNALTNEASTGRANDTSP